MTTTKEVIVAFVPLIQSFVWVALILWLIYHFREDIKLLRTELQKRIKSGDQLEFGPLRLEKVEDKVTKVEHEVNITKQFLLSMSKPMYKNLVKINSGNYGHFKLEKGSGLQRELYHLRDIGYVDVSSIRNIPNEGPDLSDYVEITPTGKKYVELRESALS